MAVPPNFRLKDESELPGDRKYCYRCVHIPDDPRFLCIKYLVYGRMDNTCDSYEDRRELQYPKNVE